MTITFNSSRIGVTSAIPFDEVTKPAISPTEAPHQPSTCSKTLRATNRQKIEFTYSLQDKIVSAQILSKGRSIPIAPENLPKELRSLPSAQAFLLYLTHSSAHVTRLGDGENRIYLNGRLLGGISYQEALANLESHLNELANPYLLKDIVERLEDLSHKIGIASRPLIKSFEDLLLPDEAQRYLTNLSEEIRLSFQDLTLPDETRRSLTILSEEIIRRVTAHVNADVKDVNLIKQVIESIQTDLSLFSPLKEKATKALAAIQLYLERIFLREPEIPLISNVISKEEWAASQTINLPPYPQELKDFLAGDCTIWPGKKRSETHIVVPLFPQVAINDAPIPLTLDSLDQLDKSSGGPGYRSLWDQIPKNIPAEEEFHYAVMTNDVIPGSRDVLSYKTQLQLIPPGYEVPGVFDAARAILWENRRSGKRYFSDNPLTYTRCKEIIQSWRLVVGNFAPSGLYVTHFYCGSVDIGVAGWRKFRL